MASLARIESWDEIADVVVLGFGLAGTSTAIEAIDLNTSTDVLIVEKMPEGLEGGNSRVSGQTLCPASDVDKLMAYQRRLNEPNPVPEEVLRAWADGVIEVEPWIERMAAEVGAEYVKGSGPDANETIFEYEELGARDAITYNATIKPMPSGVWNVFREQVRRRAIRISYDTQALELIQDPDTLEVYGVVAERAGRRIAIKARRAVVMCTGGFENNIEMQRNYWGIDRAFAFGSPGNTGDGIKMLQKAGADLWHMRNRTQSGGLWPAFKLPEYDTAVFRNIHMEAGSWIDVAADGQRFYDEGTHHRLTHYHQKVNGVWNDFPLWQVQPIHMIFDDETRMRECIANDPLMGWTAVVEKYTWSKNNNNEVQKGWITKAGSIDELAKAIGLDQDILMKTVERFNAMAEKGNDDDFGRPAKLMQPIVKPPFYAIEIVPGIITTTGGGRRNGRAQVLTPDHKPIPRLYEAGELGSIFSNLYQNGSFLVECMVFGRIAAREALGLQPWDA